MTHLDSDRVLRWLKIDPPLFLMLLVIVGSGLVILYSGGRHEMDVVIRQAVRFGLGLLFMIVLAHLPLNYLRTWTPWIYIAGTLMLMAVLAVGHIGKGAQRWLDLGFMRFQPSELMKVAVPMMMAWYLADKPLPPRWTHLMLGMIIMLVPFLLILDQPDLGTALLVFASGAFVLFLGGLSWKIILGLLGSISAAAPLFWNFVMHDYQKKRVLTLLDPEQDPLGTGYHIIQSKIAIGSGGLYGKGWLNGTQGNLEFLPESWTDFIFAVFAEEFGLIGVCILLSVYLLLIGRCLYISANAPDTYSRLLGGSLSLIFFVYAFVNIGMVSGILPVVGVPLPLISYGGTSLVTLMASFGILMSIRAHPKRITY